ncbi:MAG TPA: NADH-quinone oxidoreductase subunit C [Gaiellaceae bacterium]|nr:NADH-quinone oxidoreductase subunit C [Gaiellaceae bacterium]
MSYAGVPGLVESREAHGETTLVVDPARLVEAAEHLRDELGFNFLSDVSSVDYLGWSDEPVAGSWGDSSGRDLNSPGSWGLARRPAPKPKRFAVNYHLLRLVSGAREAPRVRMQVWVDDAELVPSVVGVWPTADWHEREVFDMMGIRFSGHPNLVRILMDDDWEGHPLRKDYPIGGEPVRFSGEE